MKQGFRIIWIIASLALMANLVHSIYDLSRRGKIVGEAQKKLELTRAEHDKLIAQKAFVESPGFVEQEARNKLNMARKGEVVAVVPQQSPSPTPTVAVPDKKNWELWAEKFRVKL